MRRSSLGIVVGLATVALVPAGAMARSEAVHHHRHKAHHVKVHHRARIRHERFGSASSTSSSTSADNAGRIQSFRGGVLTLVLGDGTTVRGKVTDATEIECGQMAVDNFRADHGRSGGDNSGPGGGDNSGPGNGDRGDDNGDRGDRGDRGDDNREANCMAADLVEGTVVREAELRISSIGAIWDKLELAG